LPKITANDNYLREVITMTHAVTVVAEIIKPKEGQVVESRCTVECEVSNLPPGMVLWAIKEVEPTKPGAHRFFPDTYAMVELRGVYRGSALIGVAIGEGHDRKVKIHVIACSPVALHKLEQYTQAAHSTGDWTRGLESLFASTILDTVTVLGIK
jgi:hypothetical protein